MISASANQVQDELLVSTVHSGAFAQPSLEHASSITSSPPSHIASPPPHMAAGLITDFNIMFIFESQQIISAAPPASITSYDPANFF